ncbi:centrosomal protein of 104 kDa isoform X2 [Leptinotarsa decemlineata]|uniref:centrosomal protein of 104 kDa isoform X2 n=1 Tax=Leptinotarsa decemlineata TaxID=7539 RepID=UPI003D308392
MPKKVEFSVIQATSEDPKYRYTELNTHGPIVKGWQSEKNCNYPQELILQLEKRCILNKIQILAHQFLIPAKVELFLSNEDSNTVDESATNINWEYLGYITLSTNESTDFKSRELKSANVPKNQVTFVKMNLHHNHFNSHNKFNQVSLIAVNMLGMDLESRRLSVAEKDDEAKVSDIMNNPEYISPYDDLAFLMYVDVDIARIIKEMELKKHLAVINERFEYARKLKNAMGKLRVAGEKLGKYELEKRHAIEIEDYERARHKKNQMDQFRNEIYEEIRVEQLMERNGVCPKNDECSDGADNINKNLLSPVLPKTSSDKRASSPNQLNHSQVSPLHMARHQSPKTGSPSTGSPTNNQSRGSIKRRNKSAGATVKSTYEMYEEKPLPALRHSQTNEFLRECQLDADYKIPSKLTEREKKQAAMPILVFGNDIVEKFYSKHYCDKEEGLNKLKEELLSYDASKIHAPNKTARGAIFLLHRALRDKVFSVYSLANEVIRLFFVQFVPGRVASAEVARSVDKLLPELLTKSGDTSQRINQMAVHTILTMADCKNVRELHIIPVHLSRPVSSGTHPRLALSRAEMVEQLIINHGISMDKQSGLTCRILSEFGSSGLHHPAEAVRKVSERILVLVYKVNPRLVRKQLPPDDDITRRNLLYRQLFHEFDRIDLQRKKEILDKNKLLEAITPTNANCLSPEPVQNHNGKHEQSKDNISTDPKPVSDSIFQFEVSSQQRSFALAKSLSGSNIQANSNNGVNGQSSSSASGISTPSNNSQKDEDEKHCIFCNHPETSILSVSNSMNSHYWRSCPMLVRCKNCSQVIEVSTLTEHLLAECEQRERYTQCSQCSEAVKTENYERHRGECKELSESCNRCPLCHENLELEDNCWKIHLMGEKPCPKNTRIKVLHQKQVKIKV